MRNPTHCKTDSRILPTLRGTHAETLAEVIIALVVIGMIGVAATGFVVSTMRANLEAKERVIAYNLAREGVESVRNLRDTNWLRFPGNRTECWDVMPDTTASTSCALATKIGSSASSGGTDYIVYPELDETNEGYALFSWKFDPIVSTTDTTLYEFSDGTGFSVVTHNPSGSTTGWNPTSARRTVNVVSTDENRDSYADVLTVASTVSWESRGVTRTVTFMDELRNY